MTRIAFGLPEVEAWAKFSGDFNPIHFDLQRARSAGLDGLVVHGMLALMPVKAELATAASASAGRLDAQTREAPWMKFHALFRRSIPHDSVSLLTLRASKTVGLDFRLNASDTQEERFRGSYAPASDHGSWLETHRLDERSFSALAPGEAQRFAQSYPAVQEGWIALDAIIFADFIRTKLDAIALMVRKDFRQVMGMSTNSGVFVQVSHTVFINTSVLRTPGPLPFDCGQLSYAMAPPELIANQGNLVGSVSLPVVHGKTLVMLIEIGLLARPAIDHH